ncbi:MAG TPA: hypothetical protein VKZ63_06515 [Kofleriaceae bacterium]|nr:hypothetical protein [Kofleriaceae bacterium]
MRGPTRAAPRPPGFRLAAWLCLALLAGAPLGCDKVDHENIDKWMSTEHGADKLRAALRSGEHDADLRAHAAQNLILHPESLFSVAKDALSDMEPSEQQEIMAALAPRLWESATQGLRDEMQVPSPGNAQAKDALFELRGFADEATRSKIDGYLIDWLSAYYEGRAKVGRVSGRVIIKQVGRAAAPKLIEEARSTLARPPGPDGERLKVGDELLAGLAWTGDAEAAGLLMDMITGDYKDTSLPRRAIAALHEAYVEPLAGTPLPGRDALLPHIDRLAAVARDENLPGVMNNDAVELISVVGPPECIPPFVELVSLPAAQEAFRWVGTQRGLRCGGAQAVVPIVEAIPSAASYERALLEKYVWKEIVGAPAPAKVAEQARQLLSSRSWVAKVTGIEVLGALALPDSAAEDAKRIRQLAGDRTRLTGWWGKQKDVPAAQRKKDPTIGQVATEVAGRLQGLAKGPKTK